MRLSFPTPTIGINCVSVSKHDYCCIGVLTVNPFPPSDLCLYKCIEIRVHGTISSVVVCQSMITVVLLLYCGAVFPFPLMLVQAYRVKSIRDNIICCVSKHGILLY